MDKQREQLDDLKKIKSIKTAFEDSMKLLEKSIAESIINKQKLQIIKKDMLEANKKINKAEECLDGLKIKLNYLKK